MMIHKNFSNTLGFNDTSKILFFFYLFISYNKKKFTSYGFLQIFLLDIDFRLRL